MSTGPSSALAAVAGSAVLVAGVSRDDDAVALVAASTFVTGVLLLLLALLKMGWISQFLSKAVINGFLFRAAIEVVIGELPKITSTARAVFTATSMMPRLTKSLRTYHELMS